MCGENKKDGVEEKWGERQETKSGKKRISQILFKNFFKNQTMTIKGNATWGKVILICDKTLLNARKTYLNRRKRGGGGGESKKWCVLTPPPFSKFELESRREGGSNKDCFLKRRALKREKGEREFLALGLARRLRIRTSLLQHSPWKDFFPHLLLAILLRKCSHIRQNSRKVT